MARRIGVLLWMTLPHMIENEQPSLLRLALVGRQSLATQDRGPPDTASLWANPSERAVRREGRPGTAADGLVEAAASFPAENRSGVWLLLESRAIAKITHRGRNVTDAAFLAHSQIKATGALKKDPRQSTRLGSTELLPQLS